MCRPGPGKLAIRTSSTKNTHRAVPGGASATNVASGPAVLPSSGETIRAGAAVAIAGSARTASETTSPVERSEVDPLDHRVSSLARRPEEHGGDAGAGDQCAVRPEQRADIVACVRDSTHELDEGVVGLCGERIPACDDPQLGVSGDPAQLLFDLIDGLTGNRAPFAREYALRGEARELLASLDQRSMERGRSDEWVARSCLKPLVEL